MSHWAKMFVIILVKADGGWLCDISSHGQLHFLIPDISFKV